MVEDTEFLISTLRQSREKIERGISYEDETKIRNACAFLNGCRISRPILSFFVQEESGYIMYPVIKFRLKYSTVDPIAKRKRNTTKTIHPGMGRGKNSVFTEMLEFYGLYTYDADEIFREINEVLGRTVYGNFTEHVDGMMKKYIQSSEFNHDFNTLKRKRAEKLRNRVAEELKQKLRVLLSIGLDEAQLCQMFRQVEVERVIGS